MRAKKRSILAVAAVLSAITPVSAGTHTWFGSVNNSFNDGINWYVALRPGPNDEALFDNLASNQPILRSLVTLDFDTNVTTVRVVGDSLAGPYTFSTPNFSLMAVNGETRIGDWTAAASTITFDGMPWRTETLNVINQANLLLTGGTSLQVRDFGGTSLQGSGEITLSNGILTTQQLKMSGSSQLFIGSSGEVALPYSVLKLEDSARLQLDAGAKLTGQYRIELNGSGSQLKFNSGTSLDYQVWAKPGGSIVGTSYIDVGNGVSSDISLDGASLTALSVCDWGKGTAGIARVDVKNGSVASVHSLNIGTDDARSQVVIQGGTLNVAGNLTAGGGTKVRDVDLYLDGGLIDVAGVATFNNQTYVELLNGTTRFHGTTTVNAGALIDWKGGVLDFASTTLNVNGGELKITGFGAELSNNATLRVQTGGKFSATSFYDVARVNTGGSLVVSGTGATFSAANTSDWGRNAGHTANVTLSSNGVANLGTLRIGEVDGAATVGISSGAKLNVSGPLTMGGGTATRNVSLSVNGGTLQADNTATFDNKAVVTLSSGAINFNGNATLKPGSTLDWQAGTLTIAATKTLTVDGGTFQTSGNSTFNSGTVALTTGAINFNGNATFNAGAPLNWSGGTLNAASGKTLTINGTTLNKTTTSGSAFSDGASLVVSGAGTFNATNYFDHRSGTLRVTGLNSKFKVGGTLSTDWANASGAILGVEIVNGALIQSSSLAGLKIATDNPGTATITITNGELITPSLSTGGAGSNVTFNLDATSTVPIQVGAGGMSLGQGTTMSVTAGTIQSLGALNLFGNAKIIPTSAGVEMNLSAASLSIASTAKLDVGKGSIYLDYDGASPVNAIRSYLQLGYNSGAWTGNGITSSYLTTRPRERLVYVDDAPSTSLYLIRALAGDANVDNTVDFNDLLSLARNYGLSGKLWANGDSNYDGVVNFDDLLALARNYGTNLPAALPSASAAFAADFATDWALAQSLVPEPGTLTFVAAGASMLRRRKKSNATPF